MGRANDFINRATNHDGKTQLEHAYHEDSVKGAIAERGAERVMHNAALDEGATAGLAFTTALASAAPQAAASYDGGHSLLVVPAEVLRGETGLWHAKAPGMAVASAQ